MELNLALLFDSVWRYNQTTSLLMPPNYLSRARPYCYEPEDNGNGGRSLL